MELSRLILEYLKVMSTPQIVIGAIGLVFLFLFRENIKSLIQRIAKIKFPGSAELLTSQSERQIKENKREVKPLPSPEAPLPGFPSGLNPQQLSTVENILKAERATSRLWEYRYLNYFLVYRTQLVLDWLINLNQPTTFSYFDAEWLPVIPSASEREAIISVLQAHHIIQVNEGAIDISPKGLEYQQWRGDLPK